jgi:hypothetical protein
VPEFGENQARTPFNVLAIVTETEEPGLLLKALTSSFAGKKGDLEKPLVEIIKGAFPQETDASK